MGEQAIKEKADKIKLDLLPPKSRYVYEKTYKEFGDWCSRNEVTTARYTEETLLVYFHEKATTVKASTLWSYYSMLKATIALEHNIDISKFCKLTAFLKRRNEGRILPEKITDSDKRRGL